MNTLTRIPTDTACEESFQWALRVIQNCVKTHRACNPPPATEYPSRLLAFDLPSSESPTQPSVCLIETDKVSAPLPSGYVCLSHRWGQSRSLKTEKHTLSSHARGIPWHSLPRTYQDAIHFTQRLGLRYLWIDSLCIVQDDEREWRHESVRMAAIYRNAFVTLAASKADDDQGGCYAGGTDRHKDHIVKLASQAGSAFQIYVREKLYHFGSFGPKDDSDVSVARPFPLLDRGWVYQERLLSPRVLYFGPKELLWECREFRTCQCQQSWPAKKLKQTYSEFIRKARMEAEAQLPNPTSPFVETVKSEGEPESHSSIAERPAFVRQVKAKMKGWSGGSLLDHPADQLRALFRPKTPRSCSSLEEPAALAPDNPATARFRVDSPVAKVVIGLQDGARG